MAKVVIDDWDQFMAFLAAQPLCKWSAKKQQEIASGKHSGRERSSIHAPPAPKNDNADLAAALSSMA